MLSFDVEDWFQVENLRDAIPRNSWDSYELRVVQNTQRLLDILEKNGIKATFFVLGWIAERVPDLIKKIHLSGHEIASHGYGHELIYNLSREEFRTDIKRSKMLLERITGQQVVGYRAPNFSITEWAIDILREEGFKYDSSLFPFTLHDRYGRLDSVNISIKDAVVNVGGDFVEVLIPTLDLLGKRIPWGGGGYFRLIPYSLYKIGVKNILRKKGAFVFYLHPWELDFRQPKIKDAKSTYKIRHYTGLKRTERKLKALLSDFKFITIQDGLKVLGHL